MSAWDDALAHHVARMLRNDLEEVEINAGPSGWWRVGTLPVPVVVRIDADDPRLVRIHADAVHDVKRRMRLLRELNDHNTFLDHVRTWWEDGTVYVGAELFVESIEPGELGAVVTAVAVAAQRLHELLPVILGIAGPKPEISLFESYEEK